MNLQEFKSALPKDWLEVRAGVVQADNFEAKTSVTTNILRLANVTEAAGAAAVELSAAELVNGVLIIKPGRSTGFTCVLTAAIDAYLGADYAIDGMMFTFNIINQEPTNSLALDSADINSQLIPKAQSAAVATTTTVYWQRIAGVWKALNN